MKKALLLLAMVCLPLFASAQTTEKQYYIYNIVSFSGSLKNEGFKVDLDDGMRTQYKYGTKYEGNDKFTQETFKALDRDHQHYETGKKIDIFANDITLSGESLSKENRHNISIIKGEETFVNENATLTRTNEGRKIEATISFNNRLGLQSIKNGKYLSPPTCLFHELGHLIDLLFVPGYNDRLNKYNNLFGGNEEEKFNIENNEHPLAKYFGEYERQTYSNGIRVVIDNEQKIFK